jgi:3',5'-cyclic AMP phosphodiesterase CpdA
MSRRLHLCVVLVALAAAPPACQSNAEVAGPATVQAPEAPAAATAPPAVALPNQDDSLKFAVLGDFGTGDRAQYETAEQMAKTNTTFPYELVITTGDNIYGSERPQDMKSKFETPYRALLDRKVKFHASLGNHDGREQIQYPLFNMDGELYYSFKAPKQSVRFFALDSTYPEPEQMQWLEEQVKNSTDDWKIAYFHHPIYSSGDRHGSDLTLRETLEPLFVKYNVSVVFQGHDHFYERVKPQNGIPYFVVGSGGKLRAGENTSPITDKGFDTDLAFLVAEINGDEMHFQTISRRGQIIDSGVITRRKPPQ